MKLQIASDLHLEFPKNREWLEANPLIPKGDILILAGDIVCGRSIEKAQPFYQQISQNFPFIISSMGNHEFYHGTIDDAYPEFSQKISQNHLKLNNSVYIMDEVKFIVTVLWSFIPDDKIDIVNKRVNDYKLISKSNDEGVKIPIKIEDTNNLFDQSVKFIKEELKRPYEGKIVVLTHHLPSMDILPPELVESNIRNAYASDLNDLILSNPNIQAWICGHSHSSDISKVGNTTIVRNPLGYVRLGQEWYFENDFIIEV